MPQSEENKNLLDFKFEEVEVCASCEEEGASEIFNHETCESLTHCPNCGAVEQGYKTILMPI